MSELLKSLSREIDRLIEERTRSLKKRKQRQFIIGILACFCFPLSVGYVIYYFPMALEPQEPVQMAMIAFYLAANSMAAVLWLFNFKLVLKNLLYLKELNRQQEKIAKGWENVKKHEESNL
jgi:Kef-type K+ transport system membrane component KefB